MKSFIKKILLIYSCLLLGVSGFSQQDPQYSLHMFNPLGVNPGYAGSREVLSAVIIHRSQWIGLEGAPETQAFAINTPMKNKKMGIGLQIINDNIGPKTTQLLKGTYAYRLKLGGGKLAFGLSGGIINYNYNWNKIEYKEQDDAIPTSAAEGFIIPTFDFGVYYNTNTFYLGLSTEHINEANYNLISIDTVNSRAKKYATSRLTVGKAFMLSDQLILKTSFLFRASNTTGNVDFNSGLLFRNKFLLGFSLRRNTLILVTEMNLSKKLRLGLAYDFDASDVANSSSGSIEFFLGYDVDLFKSKVVSPRYF